MRPTQGRVRSSVFSWMRSFPRPIQGAACGERSFPLARGFRSCLSLRDARIPLHGDEILVVVVPVKPEHCREPVHLDDALELIAELVSGPAVVVDLVVALLKPRRVCIRGIRSDRAERHIHKPHPLPVMLVARRARSLLVVADDVLERGRLSVPVDPLPAVRESEQEGAIRPEDAQMSLECADRILAVLQEVRGDDEVLALIPYACERLTVVDDIDMDQRS